ncbi:MAG: RNA methyltransferase [Oscillospiraceae bacterium]|nr:RNA methyltransferase [Oscillospiraceae bacterium]
MANVIEITDFNAPELDVYARLTERQLYNREHPEEGLFIAESPNVIHRALDAGHVPVSLLMDRKQVERHAKEVIERCGNIPVYTSSFDVLTQLTGFELTRGVLCAMHRNPVPKAEELLKASRRITVLENIVNPTNLGAIFRSAAALGMDAVLLTPACSDPLYRRCVRVSMGTVFQVPWSYIGEKVSDWPDKGMELLREYGYKTVAMALRDDSVSINDPALMAEDRIAVILGTEGDGLKDKTIADCDYTVKIPMSHGVDSLNVAAASAVAYWQLGRHD